MNDDGDCGLAYLITAKRDNATMKSERSSVLIALAKARVWNSEGWDVLITDGHGTEFPPRDFERLEKLYAPH
jgi:hypothetical protein